MRFILLSLIVLSVSCGKKNNDIQAQKSETGNALSQKSFITVNFEEGQSAFRSKLLNSIVEESFPNKEAKNSLDVHEELENTSFTNNSEYKIYREKEASMAKVVVSYSNRTEIYFLPEGIDLKKVPEFLEISPVSQRRFKMLKHDYYKTGRGQSFYYIDTSYEELMKNDQNFYSEEINLKDQFTAKPFTLGKNVKMELFVEYSAYIQQLGVMTRAGRSARCTPDMMEAGMCDSCTYKAYTAINSFEKYNDLALNELGFIVKVNEKAFSLQELLYKKLKEGFFSVTLETTTADKKIEIVQSVSKSIPRDFAGFDYQGNCASRSDRTSVTQASKVDFQVLMKVHGRGEALRSISL